MPNRHLHAAAVLTLAMAAAGCQTTSDPVVGQPAPGGGVAYTDADVAGILNTVNMGEIEAGELAATKANDAAVREFAQRMVTDHTQANEQLTAVRNADNITINNPPLATQLQSGASQTLATLNALEGVAFDRTYMDNQIAMHEWTLQTIDTVLLPSTRDRDLDNLIMNVRPVIAQHLEQARQIRTSLGQ